MCNKGSEGVSVLELQPEVAINQELQEHQVVHLMDDPIVVPSSAPSSNDDKPRVKFLCSFAGSILPRPHDGKLRYVGGETRIVSLPRDITYNELMAKMRELFNGAMVLKYQQPDEDLDALVSVVNDDDVTNMMEEYDKLGAGDGFTRLRIFLFSHSDQHGSVHFVDGDERDNERRYVDALNSLSDSPNYRRNQTSESQFFGPADNGHVALVEQFFNQMNLEGGLHNQRNSDMHMPPVNLRQLTIPPLVSVQSFSQLDSPWSPAYYSPRQPSVAEQRQVAEYPTSPSSGRYRAQYAELPDKNFDGISEEYNRNQPNQSFYEHQQQFTDSASMFPTAIPSEKSGFPGNILQGTNAFEGNSICNNCRMTFHRNHTYPESLWQHGDHPPTEAQTLGNGYHPVGTPCAECPPNRDMFILNADTSIHHPHYPGEQNEHRPVYNGNPNRERGWMLQNQSTPRAEESRSHVSGAGRISDHYIADNNMISHPQVGVPEPHYVPLHPVQHDESRYIRAGPEVGGQMFHDPAVAAGSNMHIQPMDERVMRYASPSYAVKPDGVYQVAHGHAPAHAMWRNVQSPMHGGTSYEVSGSPHLTNGLINPGYTRVEGSPRLQTGFENQNPWVSSPKPLVSDSTTVLERVDGETHRLPVAYNHGNGFLHKVDSVLSPSNILNIAAPLDPSMMSNTFALVDDKLALPATPGGEPGRLFVSGPVGHRQATFEENLEASGLGFVCVDQNMGSGLVGIQESDSTFDPVARNSGLTKAGESDTSAPVTVGCVDDVKPGNEANGGRDGEPNEAVKEERQNDCHGDLEIDSDSEKSHESKIELTKAEEEALSRGLQTIRNEDLEEIRELGTGTYGAVYHGKWRGSDVAVKRIKASCFAGRPTERERLISDFWKEAQILSSLHHPNVVSFYGVVRDGPDGSLATVTEFMVNGSLKQFLQKKDRTIDRRKRLMIAMDAAFGMEYLHGKSIVHFDLKCENLLVNMRDPHRPVCKIGDLGLSKVKQHTLVSGGVRGTLPWMAPELLSGKSNMVTEKIDVYSFGVVMWELLTGDEPYKDMHCASIIGGIVNNTLRPTIPTWCDPEWKSLMESCWAADPALRPSFSEISEKLRSMAAAMNLK